MYKSACLTIAAGALITGVATSTFAAEKGIAPLRNASESSARSVAAAMNPPLVNWPAPQFYNPPHGAFSSDGTWGGPTAKAARTLATFIPVAPCRLVDTRGVFSPVYAGDDENDPPPHPGAPAPFANGEVRVYKGPGHCGIPAGNNRVLAVSVAVTTLPTGTSGDVEVIANGRPLGGTVLMVIQAGLWNSATTVTGVDSAGNFQVQTRFSGSTDMAIDVNGYYAAMDPANVGDYFSIVGDVGGIGKGLLDVVQTGPVGAGIRATGGGGADVRLAEGATAIDVAQGEVKATNAGLNTPTFAFLHSAVIGVNICDGTSGLDSHYTRLATTTQAFHATNNLSDLLLFVQQRGGGTTRPVQTIYVAGVHCVAGDTVGNGWYLFNNATPFAGGENFAVMVIHP